MIIVDRDGLKRYEALVIGGTHAGDIIRSDSDYLALRPCLPIPEFSSLGRPPQTETFQEEVYRFVIGLRGHFNLDFWVPISVPNDEAVRWAFNQLYRSYRDEAKQALWAARAELEGFVL